MKLLKLVSLLLVLSLTLVGCGGGGSEEMLKGTVTINGRPLPQGRLIAYPESGEAVVIQVTDGKFERKLASGTWTFALDYSRERADAIAELAALKENPLTNPPGGVPPEFNIKPPENETAEQKAARLKREEAEKEREKQRQKELKLKASRRKALSLLPELPAKYKDPKESGLKHDVGSDEELKIDLKV